jgi:hypothetical protein
MVEPFHTPRAKVETKPITLHNVEHTQDPIMTITQRFEEIINDLAQNQTLIMNNITNMERVQQHAL